MKKIMLSLGVIAIVAVGAIGATRAYFTSTVTSNANTIATGKLKIAANNSGAGETFDIALGNLQNMAPGQMTEPATITVQNQGSLNAATFGKFTLDDMGTGSLAKVIDFYKYEVKYYKANGTQMYRTDVFIENGEMKNGFTTLNGGKINLLDWVNGNGPLDIPGTAWDEEGLKPMAYYTITFQFKMNENAGNEFQNKSLGFGYIVKATQILNKPILDLNLGGNVTSTIDSIVSGFMSQVNAQ